MLSAGTPVITAIGMATPLGTAETACAAARAGLNGFHALEGFESFDSEAGESVSIQGSAIGGALKGFAGPGRIASLVEIALKDLADKVEGGFSFEQIPTVIVVSNEYYWREAHWQELSPSGESLPFDVDEVLDSEILNRRQIMVEKTLPTAINLSGVSLNKELLSIVTGNQAQLFAVLQYVEQNMLAGNMESCVVGAVDSLTDQRTLENALSLQLVQTAENPVGFIPGEAACFILFERFDSAKQRGANILGAVLRSEFQQEEAHRFSDVPITGALLAEVILKALVTDENRVSEVGDMIGNINGDIWRAKEFGGALTRLPDYVRNLPLWLPNRYFGETGVVSSAIALGYGLHRFSRNCSNGENTLVWASGDDGCKGSCILSKVQ